MPPDYAKRLHLSRHQVTEEDIEAVTKVLRSDCLTRGKETRAFEEEFADYVGAKHAVACSSGTAALWLAARALNLSDYRIPAITFAATRNAFRAQKIIDVSPRTGLMDYIDEATVVVAYAGQPIDGPIIDACHALGSVYESGGKIGSIGTCCFSFHPAKTITTGEGGMVTTQDEGLAQEMRRLRDNGIVRSRSDPPGVYDNSGFGLNFHMSEIAAALGRSQLRRIESILEKRRALAFHYLQVLPKSAKPVFDAVCTNACHIYPVLIDFEGLGIPREKVMYELAKRGIETNVHYVPLQRGLPGAEAFYARELTLPLHCGMEIEDVDYVCESLAEVLG